MADLRARIDRVESRLAALDGHMNVIETTLEELRAQRRNTRSAATD